ncbi:MAG: alpha/beta hydrolase [Pseudomonadota bacterium]
MYFAPISATADALKTAPTKTVKRLRLYVGKKAISATVQIPEKVTHGLAPLLALHGISRKAETIFGAFGPACDRAGRILIVPRFSRKDWPHFQTIGRHRPDQALLALMDHLHQTGVISAGRVSLFGYSGGAQLAHRFAMLYPQRIASLHVAAAGWYCVPDHKLTFPMGLAQPNTQPDKTGGFNAASLSTLQLRAFLKLPIYVYVGREDVMRDDTLRKHPTLEAHQGRTRLARARSYIASLRCAAEARCISPDMDFTELPGCAHDFSTCAKAGMTRLVCTR